MPHGGGGSIPETFPKKPWGGRKPIKEERNKEKREMHKEIEKEINKQRSNRRKGRKKVEIVAKAKTSLVQYPDIFCIA